MLQQIFFLWFVKLLYANSEWAKHMRYPTEPLAKEWEQSDDSDEPVEGIRDVWEGGKMRDLRQRGTVPRNVVDSDVTKGFFERTGALLFSVDGVQLYRNGSYTVWPFLVVTESAT
jgi:hypothetical protein